jgi:NAD(P)H-hydrate repair Nnr-like enzyme with NAD(P)H-hydrate dehydratase domain
LTRDVEGAALEAIGHMASSGGPVVAVDVPSGIDAATGVVRGAASPASLTVTFCRAKPGHVMLPARGLVGELVVADIGIPQAIVRSHDIGLRVNAPARWLGLLPARTAETHKYRHGHAVVVGGPAHAIACDPLAAPVYGLGTAAVITRPIEGRGSLDAILADGRVTAVLIGPAAGLGTNTIEAVHTVLSRRRGTVLDADALTSFAPDRAGLLARLHTDCVLTPHDGEYARLFDVQGDRLTRALAGAREAGAVVLLKGADTVVAAPDGRASIQPAAPPALATAGSGDVLAGLVVGLLAQGMPAFEAACAATWLHASAAAGSGGGIIADDLPDRVGSIVEARSALF